MQRLELEVNTSGIELVGPDLLSGVLVPAIPGGVSVRRSAFADGIAFPGRR